MKKADYSKIAEFYDKGRSLSEQNLELWLKLISEHSGASQGAKVLDLGCGTGRFAMPMAERLGFEVTGADSSEGMLQKAQAKDTDARVAWQCQEATGLTYAPASFDVVFMSHLLHHVDHPDDVIRECYRVLRPRGALLVRYGAMEQIRDDVEHTLFPKVTEIDEARTPSVGSTERWLHAAGFVDVKSQEVVQQTYATGAEHLRAAQARSTSVLTMISEEAFETGLARLEEHARKEPDDPWLLFDRMTLTVGRKQ